MTVVLIEGAVAGRHRKSPFAGRHQEDLARPSEIELIH
jgi:hypothetical protein